MKTICEAQLCPNYKRICEGRNKNAWDKKKNAMVGMCGICGNKTRTITDNLPDLVEAHFGSF
ncbi:unnamed protein product [marine sediment metagenome]|uniref:Uncharacterized protein n=1 Tax=marine sediment metagenome TaxID=412755 RepID=X0VU11_9ZZZZ